MNNICLHMYICGDGQSMISLVCARKQADKGCQKKKFSLYPFFRGWGSGGCEKKRGTKKK